MAVWSIVDSQKTSTESRIDAEYFKPEYLELDHLLSKVNVDLWGNLEGDFITGPFGSAFTVDRYVEQSPYRYIRGKDVKPFFLLDNDNVYMPESEFENLEKYRLQEDDLLISVVGTLGNVAIVDKNVGEAVFSCKSTAYRSKSINPYYLCAYLNSNIGQLYFQRKPRGTIQTGLNIDDLRTIPLYIPDIKVQKYIGDLIKSSHTKLQQSEALYAEAEQLLLQELGLNNLDLSPQTSYVANFDETIEAKRIDAEYFQPKYSRIVGRIRSCGYTYKTLGEILEPIRNGFDYREYVKEGTPYIRVADIKKGCINLDSAVKIPITQEHIKKNLSLKIEDILFTRKGSFGNSAVVREREKHVVISSEIMLLRLQRDFTPKILSDYLALFLNSDLGYQQVKRRVHGVGYYSISQPDLAKVIISIPSLSIQNNIVQKIHQSSKYEQEAKNLIDVAKNQVEQIILGG